MAPLSHRAPGLAGAALERGDVSAEIICDGVHVHPAVARLAFAAKGPGGLMAITDGTAGSGLPRGTKATLGGRTITVGDAAHLDDGTLAGSVLTMDRAFASLRRDIGLGLVEASRSCSGTPAAALAFEGNRRDSGRLCGRSAPDGQPVRRGARRILPARSPGARHELAFWWNDRRTGVVYAGMRFAVASGLLVSSITAASCVVGVDSQALIVRDEKRFTVNGTPELQLTTFDGAIEIRSWDKPDVLVEIEKRGPTKEAVDGLRIEADQSGDRITIEVKRPQSETLSAFGIHRSSSAKLIVSAPRMTNVVARSGDGSIRIERVTGNLELRTGDGSIRASDVDGDVKLNTGDGSVHVDGGRGKLDVDTGDGSVEVAGSLTSIRLRTGDGSIVYRGESGARMSDDWDITTGDGSVTLYLPHDFSAELDAHTSDGGIRNELRLAAPAAEADPDAAASRNGDDDRIAIATTTGRSPAGTRCAPALARGAAC